ncbi:MAG: 23S rRNA (adenine(2030)-N(6))-methyltransferase RlmJ [Treponema sp.]|nr:23S rRNA (adenine(2030)-N(6))-methyltransferase RlmJ [Treponema sp.]
MTQKEKALLCVDTHAGAGLFRPEAGGEWEQGIGRLLQYTKPDCPAPVLDYLDLVRQELYPGSPLIEAKILRRQDRHVCFELHPRDFADLENVMKKYKCQTRCEDGPAMLKSLLPPPSGRALVLVDPSWEEKDEFRKIPEDLRNAVKRFPQGTYMIWYPLLLKPKVKLPDNDSIGKILFGIDGGSRCLAELYNPLAESSIHSPRGFYGSGLVIYNPPWTLNSALKKILPFLAGIFPGENEWKLEWID